MTLQPPRGWRLLVRVVAALLVVIVLTLAGVYAFAGAYGLNVVFRRGIWFGVTVAADDARLSPSMRLALRDPSGPVAAGPLARRGIAPGFEGADLPVIAHPKEGHRNAPSRLDPARVPFAGRNAPPR